MHKTKSKFEAMDVKEVADALAIEGTCQVVTMEPADVADLAQRFREMIDNGWALAVDEANDAAWTERLKLRWLAMQERKGAAQ